MNPIADRYASAARFILARCHGFGRDEQVVQATQAGKPDLMSGLQQILRSDQPLFRSFLGQELQEALRADSCPPGKESLKMVLAQTHFGGNFGQLGLLSIMVFKVHNCLLDAQVIFRLLF